MKYNNFNILDGLSYIAGCALDPYVKDFLKSLGITDEQLHEGGVSIALLSAKSILLNYIAGKQQNFYYELYPIAVFSLKQFTMSLNDISLTNKVSVFLNNPCVTTAQDAIGEFNNYELKNSTIKLIDNI